eukprot:m.20885 g.20885  ORF g.20885 m.20885 type:complete len:301 (-) comp11064_c0_seq1:80-982(-)
MDVWHAVQDGSDTWFVQHTVANKELLVLITNFEQLWLESLPAETVNERNTECNPHMNFATSKLLATISTALSSAEGSSNNITLSHSPSNDVIDLEASTMAVGGKLRFAFKATCRIQPSSVFANYVTRPLLAVASSAITSLGSFGNVDTSNISPSWSASATLQQTAFQTVYRTVTAALHARSDTLSIAQAWSPPAATSLDSLASVGLLDPPSPNKSSTNVYDQPTLETLDQSSETSPFKAPAPVSEGDADSTQTSPQSGKRSAFGKTVWHQQDLNDSVEGKELLQQATQPPAKKKKKKKKL